MKYVAYVGLVLTLDLDPSVSLTLRFFLHRLHRMLQQPEPGVELALVGPETLVVGRELHAVQPARVIVPLVVVERG